MPITIFQIVVQFASQGHTVYFVIIAPTFDANISYKNIGLPIFVTVTNDFPVKLLSSK